VVYDVEDGGKPLLTQRLADEADDELAELAAEMDQVGETGLPGWRAAGAAWRSLCLAVLPAHADAHTLTPTLPAPAHQHARYTV
jgi:hypothetical protein